MLRPPEAMWSMAYRSVTNFMALQFDKVMLWNWVFLSEEKALFQPRLDYPERVSSLYFRVGRGDGSFILSGKWLVWAEVAGRDGGRAWFIPIWKHLRVFNVVWSHMRRFSCSYYLSSFMELGYFCQMCRVWCWTAVASHRKGICNDF